MPGKLVVSTIETQNINFDSDTVGMTIDNVGRVTASTSRPAFLARRTSSQVTGTVVFDTVMLNQGSHYNNSTGIFTAPIAGLYSFSFNVLSDNNGGNSYFATSLYKNGSGYAKVQNRTEDDNDFGSGMSIIASLAATDTVQVVQHNVNVYGTASSDENMTWFSGYLVG